jgi:FemAB-related protein (PEP-CTERM system-associated)
MPRLNAHEDAWLEALHLGLGHETRLLTSSTDSTPAQLPLVLVRGRLFGDFLVSLPYLNTGGVYAADSHGATDLVDQAVALADQYDVKHLELRHETPLVHPKLNAQRTDKVHMRLNLPASSSELMASFKSKLRSQLKKSMQHGLDVRWGSLELLPEFYAVFAHNMRDLGTPVYSRGLFAAILKAFGDRAELCVVGLQHKPIAAAILVHGWNATEVPSASSLRQYNYLSANMFMYWHLLQRSIDRGSTVFDFGRSSLDSGTYKFKEQWGATAHPACWQYYVRRGAPEDMRPDSPNKQRLIAAWQKLPVWFTKIIGPAIVRGIP